MAVFWNTGTVWPWFLFNCCSPRAQLGPQLARSHPSQICQYHSIVPLSASLWLSHFNLPIQINPKLGSDICGWAPCLSTIGIWKLDLKLRRKKTGRGTFKRLPVCPKSRPSPPQRWMHFVLRIKVLPSVAIYWRNGKGTGWGRLIDSRANFWLLPVMGMADFRKNDSRISFSAWHS